MDGKLDWKEYQKGVEKVFIGWEEEVGSLNKCGKEEVEEVWSRWKEKVITAAEKEIVRKKLQR